MVPLPHAVKDVSLQLLNSILPQTLQLWQDQLGATEPARDSAPAARLSGSGRQAPGGRAGANGRPASSSAGPEALVPAAEVATGLAGLVMLMAGSPTGQLRDVRPVSGCSAPDVSTSAGATTAATNGQLCAMMDSLFRMQLAAEQAAVVRGSDGSSGLYDTEYDRFRESVPIFVSSQDPRQDVGSLIKPILAHSSPGSKP